jgi:hypothetical protein
MNRFLIAPAMAAVVLMIACGAAAAQSAFPAPLPGPASQPPVTSNPPAATVESPKGSFPSNGAPPMTPFGAAPLSGVSGECTKDYALLREDAETKIKLITAARERQASPAEACRLITGYRSAEAKLVKYVETNSARCTIPVQITQQLKSGLEKTEAMASKVCTLARELQQKRAPAGPTGDFWPATTNAPM